MEAGTVLLLVGAILAGSLVVALGAARVGVPSLIAFLVLGMVLGSDGIGGIHFDDAELARTVGAALFLALWPWVFDTAVEEMCAVFTASRLRRAQQQARHAGLLQALLA